MRLRRTLPAAVALAAALGACGGPTERAGQGSPAATVVTDDWALGRVASAVGGGSLAVERPGATLAADAVVVTSPRSSAAFVAAATSAPHHLGFTGDALVPGDVATFAAQLAGTLTALAPARATTWRDGLAAVRSQAHSTTGDLEASLQSCPRRRLVTDGPDLVRFAAIGDVTAVVVTPATAAAEVRAAGGTVFALEGADDAALRAAAAAAGAKVVAVSSLATPPPAAPASLGYAGGVEDVLATVTKGLGCPLDQ